MFNEREKLILQVLLKNTDEALSIKEIAKATKIKRCAFRSTPLSIYFFGINPSIYLQRMLIPFTFSPPCGIIRLA